MTKRRVILLSISVVAAVACSVVILNHGQARVRDGLAALQQENDRLVALSAQQRELSNQVMRLSQSMEPSRELVKLRQEAMVLRKQTNDLGTRSETARYLPWENDAQTTTSSSSVAANVVSDSDSDEYKTYLYRMASAHPHTPPFTNNSTLNDARMLRYALNLYAREHEGEFPESLEQAAPYYRAGEPVPESNGFEMVYRGSLAELTNVPLEAVALLREKQAWPTPRGKWARAYVMVGGDVRVVESEDSFRSWEARHVVPPLDK